MIKELRKKYRYQQQELANMCKFSGAKLSKLENGTQIPTIEDLAELTKAFMQMGINEEEFNKLKTLRTKDINWREDVYKNRESFRNSYKQIDYRSY